MHKQEQTVPIAQGCSAQSMSLQEFKQKVEEHLLMISGSEVSTQMKMKQYEPDFSQLWQENWSVEATATGMLMGYI